MPNSPRLHLIAGQMVRDKILTGVGAWRETMTPVNRPDLDRVVAVVDRLKDTAKALETLHDVDRALARFEKVISEDVGALRAAKN